jgi:DNA end-binding protein Ku
MVVHTLLWPDEIRDPDFPSLDTDVEVRAPELKMAGQVVESMTDDFHPEQYTDTYQEQLQEMVEAKLAGGQAFATTEAPAKLDDTEDVSDLLAKLEASVRRRREESAARTKAEPEDEPAATAPAKKSPAKKASAKTPAKAPAKAAAKKAPAKAAAKASAKR